MPTPNQITFERACFELADAVRDGKYKVIHRYANSVPWSFKFEKGVKIYDPIEVLYLHTFQTERPREFHIMFNSLVKQGFQIQSLLYLLQLSNGLWKIMQGVERLRYLNAKDTLEQTLGIEIK